MTSRDEEVANPSRRNWRKALRSRLQAWLSEVDDSHKAAIFQRHVDEGRVQVGRHTYGTPEIHADRNSPRVVRIGQFCSIASGVEMFSGGNHDPSWISTFPLRIQLSLPGAYSDGMPSSKGDLRIGNDVWIGTGALILSGVTIGDGAVVGARAVVAKDVAPYSIVAGNPARLVRFRVSPELSEALLRIRWWDWPMEKIVEATPLLSSNQIDEFVRRYDTEVHGGNVAPAPVGTIDSSIK